MSDGMTYEEENIDTVIDSIVERIQSSIMERLRMPTKVPWDDQCPAYLLRHLEDRKDGLMDKKGAAMRVLEEITRLRDENRKLSRKVSILVDKQMQLMEGKECHVRDPQSSPMVGHVQMCPENNPCPACQLRMLNELLDFGDE